MLLTCTKIVPIPKQEGKCVAIFERDGEREATWIGGRPAYSLLVTARARVGEFEAGKAYELDTIGPYPFRYYDMAIGCWVEEGE